MIISSEEARRIADKFHVDEKSRVEEYANNWVKHIKGEIPWIILRYAKKGQYKFSENFWENEDHMRLIISSKTMYMKDIIRKKIKEYLPDGYSLSEVYVTPATFIRGELGVVSIDVSWDKKQDSNA